MLQYVHRFGRYGIPRFGQTDREYPDLAKQIFPDFTSNSEEKFIYIISTKYVELINITSKFLQDVTKTRGKI